MKSHPISKETLVYLTKLYREAKELGDSNAIMVAEAAMTSFQDAEAALSRLFVSEALVAEYLKQDKATEH